VDAKSPGWIVAEKLAEARARGGGRCLKRTQSMSPARGAAAGCASTDPELLDGPADTGQYAGAALAEPDPQPSTPKPKWLLGVGCHKKRCVEFGGTGIEGLWALEGAGSSGMRWVEAESAADGMMTN